MSKIAEYVQWIIVGFCGLFVSALFAVSIYDIFVYDKTDKPANLCLRYPDIITPGRWK